MRSRNREGYSGQTGTDEQLHADDPPAFRLEQVDERTPQGLNDPWKVQPAGVQGNFRIGNAHSLVHDKRKNHDCDVGKPLSKIESGHPFPG